MPTHCQQYQTVAPARTLPQYVKNMGPQGFPGGTVVKNLPAKEGDTGSSPGPGRSHMPRSN